MFKMTILAMSVCNNNSHWLALTTLISQSTILQILDACKALLSYNITVIQDSSLVYLKSIVNNAVSIVKAYACVYMFVYVSVWCTVT